MSNRICIHCYVSGRVQGVWFRASTQTEAMKLNLTGWTKNLPDGRVEVMVCGDQDKVEVLYQWLKKGPRLAEVTDLSREELPLQEFRGFEVI